jgi:queuine tRNA-ribosyltransferase
MPKFSFEVKNTYKKARIGQIQTAHGVIDTPAFMPVGTNACMKCLKIDDIYTTGSQIILANTYHLMLRPGAETVNKLGGLHKFSNCKLPILTDSGGFQVMSLSKLNNIKDDGVMFKSHLDGSKHFLTPKLSTDIQYLLDSDITMVLDICTKEGATYEVAKRDVHLTNQWAKICRENFKSREGYGQFGIMQGNVFKDLRKISAEYLVNLDFEGYAIGGVIIGAQKETLFSTLDYAADLLPKHKPRYVMGIGAPEDIIGCVQRGADMFDCVLPARSARHGLVFTSTGKMNIKNAINFGNNQTLDETCLCFVCKSYTKGYLHHLFKCKEALGPMLLTYHNIYYYQSFMDRIRQYIKDGKAFDFIT